MIRASYVMEAHMEIGHFYFVKDDYIKDFPDDNIQRNHETVSGISHDKPYFCALKEDGIYWMVPISSKTNKYSKIEAKIKERYGKCDTIKFCDVLGHNKAFLLQNMCPITDTYIKNEYMDTISGLPVRIDGAQEKKLIIATKKVLNKHKHGTKAIFPNVDIIAQKLKSKN